MYIYIYIYICRFVFPFWLFNFQQLHHNVQLSVVEFAKLPFMNVLSSFNQN